mgnify:CR=1 FL=1
MRWILLDEVVGIEKRKWARTRSRIPSGEFSRELLLLEMMAQTGGLLLGAESDFQDDLIFAKIEKACFFEKSREMTEGERIAIEATSESLRSEGSWIDSSIEGQEERIAQARLLLVNAGRLIPGFPRSITFPENFLNHFQVRQKVR